MKVDTGTKNDFDNKKLRPLCLSLWSPPVVRPQAILLGKMLPECIRQGVKPVLVTYEDCRGWGLDIPIYYIEQKERIPLLSRIPFIEDVLEERYLQEVSEYIAKIVKKHKCNVIYSFAKPHISNLIGACV